MKRKLYGIALTLGVLATIITADTIQNDMTKGYDFTSASSVTASKLNQLVDQAIPATNRGMIIYTNSAPTAADLVNAPRLSRFIWLKSTDNPPTVFTYNTNSSTWESAGIADGSITLPKLATDSVNSDKIVNASVTGTDIAASTVANANLADNSVTSSKIQDGTITSADLLTNTISLNYLTADSVNSAKIVDASIVAADIASRTITSDLISVGGINVTNMATNAITSTNITDAAVTVAKLGAGSAYQTYRVNAGATAVEWIDSPFLQYSSAQTTNSYDSGANTLAINDTVFTTSLGTEATALNLTVTPKKTGSKLLIKFSGSGYVSPGYIAIVGIFIDGTVASTRHHYNYAPSGNLSTTIVAEYQYTTPSTTAVAITVRIASNTSSGFVLNKNTASTSQAGSMFSTLTVTEVQ